MAGLQATPVPTATPRTAVPGDGAVPLAAGTATGPAAVAAGAAGAAGGVLVSEPDRAHALAVLSRHLGPIARIVVKRAADKATSKAQLIELLIESAGDRDQAALLKDWLGTR